jgi:hypothetical protein
VLRNARQHITESFWPSSMASAREEYGAPLTFRDSERINEEKQERKCRCCATIVIMKGAGRAVVLNLRMIFLHGWEENGKINSDEIGKGKWELSRARDECREMPDHLACVCFCHSLSLSLSGQRRQQVGKVSKPFVPQSTSLLCPFSSSFLSFLGPCARDTVE